MPRRPPRHPSSPSTRSRSLAAEPVSLPRPRSRSLDGLLDEDGILADLKKEESSKDNSTMENACNIKTRSQSLSGLLENGKNKQNGSSSQIDKTDTKTGDSEPNSSETNDSDPQPVPRSRRASSLELKSAKVDNSAKIAKLEDMRISSSSDEGDEKEENLISSTVRRKYSENKEGDLEKVIEGLEDTNDEDLGQERLLSTRAEKSTLLKAKSCGAGLDSDDNYLSEYKPVIKGQGSLLSLPAGAEPKRKKNFMDKCVNKVRSFIKK